MQCEEGGTARAWRVTCGSSGRDMNEAPEQNAGARRFARSATLSDILEPTPYVIWTLATAEHYIPITREPHQLPLSAGPAERNARC